MALAALLVVTILLIASTVHQTRKVRALSQQTENHYMAAFSDLCDYVDDIDVLTKKASSSLKIFPNRKFISNKL